MMDYPITIHNILVSPGHNYFGQPKGQPGTRQTYDVEQVAALAGRGLEGDRFLDARPDFDGQITFFSWEVFRLLVETVLVKTLTPEDASPLDLRRNVVIEGVPLNQLIGQEFTIRYPAFDEQIGFIGARHCHPCHWMETCVAQGALKFLKGRGGLRAKISSDGLLRKGAAILSTDLTLDMTAIVVPLARPRLP